MKSIRDLYKQIQKCNITKADLGYVFVSDLRGDGVENTADYFKDQLENITHFDIYSNWYLPFDRSTCFHITNSINDRITTSFSTITFIDNPEHKLTSLIDFIVIHPYMGTLIGSVAITPNDDECFTHPEKHRSRYPDRLVIKAEPRVSGYTNDKYSMMLYLKTFIMRDSTDGTEMEFKLCEHSLDEDGNFELVLGQFGGPITAGFAYFTRLLVDTNLFVVEERVAIKKKGVIKLKVDKQPLFHVIDIKTLRSKYFKRELNSSGVIKVGHERRRHTRTFRSDYYKNKKGETITINPTWVGPTEYFDKEWNRFYKVRLDIG